MIDNVKLTHFLLRSRRSATLVFFSIFYYSINSSVLQEKISDFSRIFLRIFFDTVSVLILYAKMGRREIFCTNANKCLTFWGFCVIIYAVRLADASLAAGAAPRFCVAA